ncbi:oxidoreductase [Acrocarpospora phusangensis]|uniref:Oxidoreductase n=1 Tax=Acrocarpospora phusangensis TaxID=1070424 RepID=A0A919QDR4_9ACTN|nr:aldo/keto reductase [Acrocarpospora phusangensis]GIH25839.1 oxidoreductase [Acrocarpospora phusangensis]
MVTRTLGRSGIVVSALGFGCWPIGGAIVENGRSVGWGAVDDGESIRAIHQAMDLGVTFFDTADVYGRSEDVLGRALAGRWDQVVIASKFGRTYDRATHTITGEDSSPAHLRRALEGSLRRLGTDVIDLYQLHLWDCPEPEALALRVELEALVEEGKIRAYGWSTDRLSNVELFAAGPHCATAQIHLNVLEGDRNMVTECARLGLAAIVRGPLAMGLLGGKYSSGSALPTDDVRGSGQSWISLFRDGRPTADGLRRLAAIGEVLTSDGRTLAQGALGWLWAVGENTVPIPGFKGMRQAGENAGALAYGPLSPDQMAQVDALLKDGET